jgi:hypothetical protein
MKQLIVILTIALTGCASPEFYYAVKKQSLGYKPYDPCIRCGETWQQLPNMQNEAILRRQRGEQW